MDTLPHITGQYFYVKTYCSMCSILYVVSSIWLPFPLKKFIFKWSKSELPTSIFPYFTNVSGDL